MKPVQINKITEENIFHILINYFEILGIDNKVLAEEVLANQTRRSDCKNYSMYEDTVFGVENGVESARLLAAVNALAKNSGLELKDTWSQIHYPRESTSTHDHLPHQMAFVYYVEVPEGSGDLVFSINNYVFTNVTPIQGRLCVFPAWVPHKVSKNTGQGIRISVSGNLA
jgi:hypothetical protein